MLRLIWIDKDRSYGLQNPFLRTKLVDSEKFRFGVCLYIIIFPILGSLCTIQIMESLMKDFFKKWSIAFKVSFPMVYFYGEVCGICMPKQSLTVVRDNYKSRNNLVWFVGQWQTRMTNISVQDILILCSLFDSSSLLFSCFHYNSQKSTISKKEIFTNWSSDSEVLISLYFVIIVFCCNWFLEFQKIIINSRSYPRSEIWFVIWL